MRKNAAGLALSATMAPFVEEIRLDTQLNDNSIFVESTFCRCKGKFKV